MTVNRQELIYPLLARTASPAPDAQLNIREASGVMIVVDVTLVPGPAPDLRPQFFVPGASGGLSMFAQAAAVNNIVGVGTFTYIVYPRGTEAAPTLAGTGFKERLSFPIPSICIFRMLHGNINSVTYSVRAYYLS